MYPSKIRPSLFVIAIIFLGFAGYSFMSAATTWVAPAGAPPANNVDVPVNIGTSLQVKNGPLGTDNLSVIGNESVTGYLTVSSTPNSVKITNNNITVTSAGPFIQFTDTDAGSLLSRLLYSTNALIVQGDRNANGIFDDSPNPLLVYIGSTAVSDYMSIANQVRAPFYCDQNGKNCFGAGEVGQIPGVSQMTANIRGKETVTGYVQAGFTANTGVYQQNIKFPIAYQTNSVPVVTMDGNYAGGENGYPCNIDNTGFYVCGETTPPTGSSGWGSPDTSKGHFWNAIGIRDDEANDPTGGGAPVGKWYQANNITCAASCSSRGKLSVTDPVAGGFCISGENRPSVTPSGITYTYGTWGGASGAGTSNSTKSSGYMMCYKGGQDTDEDITDVNVACYCK